MFTLRAPTEKFLLFAKQILNNCSLCNFYLPTRAIGRVKEIDTQTSIFHHKESIPHQITYRHLLFLYLSSAKNELCKQWDILERRNTSESINRFPENKKDI